MPNYPGGEYQDSSDINDECNNFVINGLSILRLLSKFIHTYLTSDQELSTRCSRPVMRIFKRLQGNFLLLS